MWESTKQALLYLMDHVNRFLVQKHHKHITSMKTDHSRNGKYPGSKSDQDRGIDKRESIQQISKMFSQDWDTFEGTIICKWVMLKCETENGTEWKT